MCVLCLFFLQKWGSKCHCVCGKKHVTGTPPSVPCSRARSVSLSLSRMFSPSPRNSLPGSQWLLPYADFCLDGAPGCLLCQESCWVCLPGPGLSRSGLSVPWATIWVGHSLSVPRLGYMWVISALGQFQTVLPWTMVCRDLVQTPLPALPGSRRGS